MSFNFLLPQNKSFQLSDEKIHDYLKPHLIKTKTSDEKFSNGYFEVAKKDCYGEAPPSKVLAFTGYVADCFGQDLELLKSKSKSRKFPNAWKKWQEKGIIRIYPYVKAAKINAYYTPENGGELHFFVVTGSEKDIYACQNYDIVAHETGHAVLHIVRPDLEIIYLETRSLHEAWGDLTVIFSLLRVQEIRKRFLEKTNGDLMTSSFVSRIGESLEKGKEIRNAINNKKLSNVEKEPHDYSNVFTAAVYEILATAYKDLREHIDEEVTNDQILEKVVEDLRLLVLEAFITTQFPDPSFSDIGKRMKKIADENEKLSYISKLIRKIFLKRGIDIQQPHQEGEIWNPKMGSLRSSCCHTLLHLSKSIPTQAMNRDSSFSDNKSPSGFSMISNQSYVSEPGKFTLLKTFKKDKAT